jgi:ribosomal protein L16 Arg81 hydroxylase
VAVLADLLHPYDVERFLSQIWTQKSLYIPGASVENISATGNTCATHKFASLFSWAQLNQLLNFHHFDYPLMRLAKDGEVLPATENEKFVQRCQEGATLILDHVHQFLPHLSDFCGQLRSELGHPVQMNLYSSGPEKQGFRCHYDTHEVFILQIEGCKTWHVFEPTWPYPLVDQKSAHRSPPAADPDLTCVLEPGDLLYIPRGHWHYAVALDQPSLHLTLGVLGKTGLDYLEWLLEDLKQQAIWRENLPVAPAFDRSAHNSSSVHPIQNHLDHLMQHLHQYLQQNSQLATYRRYYASLEKPIANYAFPQQLGFQILNHGMETRFSWAKYQHVYAEPLPDQLPDQPRDPSDLLDQPSIAGYRIIAGSKQITLCGVPQAFIQTWLGQNTFSGQDLVNWLPDFDWASEILPLLQQLVQSGVILADV